MPAPMVTERCWEVRVFSRGGRRLYDKYSTREAAAAAAAALHGQTWVVESTRRVAGFRQPAAPSSAQRHREAESDRMAVLRQATTYHKSGFNGTEIPALPSHGETL